MKRLTLLAATLLVCAAPALKALDNGLARTPPMGWNSWNKFGCNVSEQLIKEAADAVVSSGMKDAGYQFVVIDDCWQVSRDDNGNIIPDAKRFPSGMKALADYIHSKGLKFGIYSDAGTGTCQNRPGSHGGLESYAGPGHWNDPDMLEVGNGGLTNTESRSHFSMWAILAAPLMAGNDIRSMNKDIREILTNKEVVAVDQDPLGVQGRRVKREGSLEVWSKQMADGSRAVALLNRGSSEAEIKLDWTDIGYPDSLKASLRDLWEHKDLGMKTGSYSAAVPTHGVALLTVKPQ